MLLYLGGIFRETAAIEGGQDFLESWGTIEAKENEVRTFLRDYFCPGPVSFDLSSCEQINGFPFHDWPAPPTDLSEKDGLVGEPRLSVP